MIWGLGSGFEVIPSSKMGYVFLSIACSIGLLREIYENTMRVISNAIV